jgi:hypothetical protein
LRTLAVMSFASSFAVAAGAALVLAGGCAKVQDPGGDIGSGGRSGPATGSGGRTAGGGGGDDGAGGRPGTGGIGGLIMGAGGEGMCGFEKFDLERKPAVVMLVLDRSASMKDNLMDEIPTGPADPTKWSQVIPALTQTIPMIGGDISWGMKVFPEGTGSACTGPTVTSAIDVPVAPMNAARLVQAIGAVTPEGNGTPTGAAVTVAADHLRMLPATSRKYILLATDGQPSCYGTAGALGQDTNQARTAALNAVTASAQAGIHVFVVGVVTKPTDTMTLNMLAVAGLEARPDPNPLATKFYQATTQTELSRALEAITGVVSTCVFPLSKTPPAPDKIAVKVSGVKAPQDPTHLNGWDYTNAQQTEIQVYGSWCEMIRTTAANMVEITFGCPNVPPPD